MAPTAFYTNLLHNAQRIRNQPLPRTATADLLSDCSASADTLFADTLFADALSLHAQHARADIISSLGSFQQPQGGQ
jgi:hypothetical protein